MIQDDLKWYRENHFPETVVDSAEKIGSQIEKYYEITFDGLFVSNKKNESTEEYPSLWLYNNDYVVESKDFLVQSHLNIDLARYKGNVKYINIDADNFTALENPTMESKIKLQISIGDNLKCVFDAVGINCLRLSNMAKMFIAEHKERP